MVLISGLGGLGELVQVSCILVRLWVMVSPNGEVNTKKIPRCSTGCMKRRTTGSLRHLSEGCMMHVCLGELGHQLFHAAAYTQLHATPDE